MGNHCRSDPGIFGQLIIGVFANDTLVRASSYRRSRGMMIWKTMQHASHFWTISKVLGNARCGRKPIR